MSVSAKWPCWMTSPARRLAAYDCRNNRLALLGLQQDGFAAQVQAAKARHGADRVGVFMGSSTSGILSSEVAYRQRDPPPAACRRLHYRETHNAYSVADFVRKYFALSGPAMVVSTACSSSAKVFGTAQRMLAAGLIDAAIVGGVDSLCLTTIYGFSSLQLVSSEPCRPFDAARDGISIGEGAAYVLLERGDLARPGDIILSGVGESSDAYHMSSPHPEGLGARMAMAQALQMAGLQPADIGYINLHGTATPSNDAAEGPQCCRCLARTRRAAPPRATPAIPWALPVASRPFSVHWHCAKACCPAVLAPASWTRPCRATTCCIAAAALAACAEQFFRFWRQQLQSGFSRVDA
jgi:3-oxoacyl-(acyl-carrier-protein) synthase